MGSDDMKSRMRALAERALDRMPEADSRLASKITKLHQPYFESDRDKVFVQLFGMMNSNALATLKGQGSKKRIGVIIGGSDGGKSTALRWHMSRLPELQPYEEDGIQITPAIIFDAPKPCKPKSVLIRGIKTMGYPTGGIKTEDKAMEIFQDLVVENGVSLCVIDEMQNVFAGNNRQNVKNMQDLLRSVTQIEDWPLHVVVAGVDNLMDLMNEHTLKSRRIVRTLSQIRFPKHCAHVRKIMAVIIERDAELVHDDLLTDLFVHKVMHAGNFQWGGFIAATRAACEAAFRAKARKITNDHFAAAFALVWDCEKGMNVFLTTNWNQIDTSMTKRETDARKRG
jgi:Cdc6-like AAA superfamily ATPase